LHPNKYIYKNEKKHFIFIIKNNKKNLKTHKNKKIKKLKVSKKTKT
jgi:REP element-mobilizing transposase RayT